MSSREGSGKKFHPFKYQTSLISKKHILLVAPASKNRFRKSGSEFSAKYHWAGLLALSVYVNSDIGLFTLSTFYGSTIRKFRFTISKVCFEFSRAHARSASALSARNAANATLIVLPFDVHRRYLTIYPSLHPVIDYRPWRGMNTRVGYVRGQCVLSVCVCVCRARNLSRGQRRFVNGGRKIVMTY